MRIRKSYNNVNPELLYDEVRDFVLKQGATVVESKLETYLVPDNTSSFIFRGNLVFKVRTGQDKAERECLRAHIVGMDKGETKLMFDINDEIFSEEKMSALQDDLNFIFESYEAGIDDDEA